MGPVELFIFFSFSVKITRPNFYTKAEQITTFEAQYLYLKGSGTYLDKRDFPVTEVAVPKIHFRHAVGPRDRKPRHEQQQQWRVHA